MGFLEELPQQIVYGLTLGSVYGLIALGYSMVYGILELLNFAHGEVFTTGAFIGWGILSIAIATGLAVTAPWLVFLLMMLAAMVGCAILGYGVERLAYRPLRIRNAPRLAPLMSALGVSIFLQNAIMLTMGSRAKFVDCSAIIPEVNLTFGHTHISLIRIIVIVVSLILMYCLDRFVRRTNLGKAMRATAQDREAASLMGIDVNRVIAITFLIGSALGGAGGVLVGLYYTQIDFYMGFLAGMKAFTAAVLGGIGNLRGAMLGGIVLGLVESLGTAFILPVYKDVISFVILVLVLIVRPSGLLGEQVPDRV